MTFVLTGFEYRCVEALTRAGEYDKPLLNRAVGMFEDFLLYLNHVGLCTEEISEAGEACVDHSFFLFSVPNCFFAGWETLFKDSRALFFLLVTSNYDF